MPTRNSQALFQTPPITQRLYTAQEAAEYLGRSLRSVRELIWAGKLPVVKVGRRIRLDLYDLDDFIELNKVREDS